MSSPRLVFPSFRLDPDSPAFKEIAEILFGGSIKDEEKPEEKLKTDEVVKAFSDECEGSKSERINQVGKDEDDLGNRPEKKLRMGKLDYCIFDVPLPDYYGRRDRSLDARRFTDHYKFAPGKKICVHPYGPPIACLSDYCFKSSWVGVYGMQSMCIVTCRDMDMTCLPAFYQRDCMKRQNMEMFARATISEVECLPHNDVDYYDAAFRRSCTGIVKPFAVVSPGQGVFEECGHEGSKPLRCCVLCANEYLRSALSSNSVNTHYGIIQVAIKAYQLMCPEELRADDIWVTIMEDVEPNCFDHLPIDVIGEQLDLVNGLSSEMRIQRPLLKYCGSLQ